MKCNTIEFSLLHISFSKRKKKRLYLLLLAGLSLNLLLSPFASGAIVIDDFSDGSVSLTGFDNSYQAGDMLGGERDIEIETPFAGPTVFCSVSGGTFSLRTREYPVFGGINIVWDGTDNLASTSDIDATGLGGVDLTSGGSLDGILLTITLDNISVFGGESLVVYTDAGNYSIAHLNFPLAGSDTNYFVPFSSFNDAYGSGADFTNVGAVRFTGGFHEGLGNLLFTLSHIQADSSLSATQTDALLIDNDLDGFASPGDTFRYTVSITNPDDAADAATTGVAYSASVDSNTTLVVGSVTTSAGTVTTGNVGGDTTVGVAIGDIVDNSSVTITYDVLIALPFDGAGSQISSQGSISSDGVSALLTDDPATEGSNNPTLTPIAQTIIGDFVWNDINGDGIQSGGSEVGIAGVTLDVYYDTDNSATINGGDALLGTVTTSDGGAYSFGLPNYNNYVVDVTDTGSVLTGATLTGGTDPKDISVASEGTNNDVDFGFYRANNDVDFPWWSFWPIVLKAGRDKQKLEK